MKLAPLGFSEILLVILRWASNGTQTGVSLIARTLEQEMTFGGCEET